MKKILMLAGIVALAATFSSTELLAKPKGGQKGNAHGAKSLARADAVAGSHGLKGRDIARTRGANQPGFCPPGQLKKPGAGSRFQC